MRELAREIARLKTRAKRNPGGTALASLIAAPLQDGCVDE
jgi:hypothetical protein